MTSFLDKDGLSHYNEEVQNKLDKKQNTIKAGQNINVGTDTVSFDPVLKNKVMRVNVANTSITITKNTYETTYNIPCGSFTLSFTVKYNITQSMHTFKFYRPTSSFSPVEVIITPYGHSSYTVLVPTTSSYTSISLNTYNVTTCNINVTGLKEVSETSYTTEAYVDAKFENYRPSVSYNDLSNKPTIPTNTSQLTNDTGYVTNSIIKDVNGVEGVDFGDAVNSYIESYSGGKEIVYEPKIGFSETMIDIPETYYDDYGNMMTRPKDNPATDTYMTSCDTWSCDISNSEDGQLMWKQDYTSTMYSTYCGIAFKNETPASNFKLEANLQPQTDGMYLPRVPYMLVELNYNTGNYNYDTGRYEYGDNFTYCCIKPTPTSGVLTFDSTDTWYSKDKNGTDLTPIDLSTVTFNPTVFQQSEYGDYQESYFTVNVNLRGTIESTIEAAQTSWDITGYNAFYYGDMFKYVSASVSTIDSCRKSFLQAVMQAAPTDNKPAKCKMAIVESEDETRIIDFAEDCKATMNWNGDNEITTVKGTGIKLFHKFDDGLKQIMVDYELVAIADMMSKDITSWVQKITYNGEEIQVKEENFNGGGGGSTEIAISETEPTGDETVWINPDDIMDVLSDKNDIYSTDEIETNKIWIDGKKIYRKVIACGALPSGGQKDIPMNIINLDYIINMQGISCRPSNMTFVQLNWVRPDNPATGVGFWAMDGNICILDTQDRHDYSESYVILEYTKK